MGLNNLDMHLTKLITNIPLIMGFVFYGMGSIMMVVAYSGGKLSTLHPFLSLSYVVIAISAPLLFNEYVGISKWIGIIFIVIGVIIVGIGDK